MLVCDFGWLQGRAEDGRVGSFPKNLVQRLDAPAPARSVPVERRSGRGSSRRLSLRASMSIKSVEVPKAERRVPRDATDGRERTMYTVVVVTDEKTNQVFKRYHEIRKLDEQLRSMFPDAIFVANPSATALMRDKRSERIVELRRLTMSSYLQGLMADPNMTHLLLTFLMPGERVELEADDSPPTPSASPEPASAVSESLPEPVAAIATSPALSSGSGLVRTARKDFAEGSARAFALDSCDSFDELLDHGFTLQNISGSAIAPVREGDKINVKYTAMIWDGAQDAATEYEAMESCEFSVGDRVPELPDGLHAAVVKLGHGQSATIVLAPSLGFGEAGLKGLVPALAHLVFDITILGAAAGAKPPVHRGGTRRRSIADLEADLKAKYGDRVGTLPSRNSFAPHSGRQRMAVVSADASSPKSATVDSDSRSDATRSPSPAPKIPARTSTKKAPPPPPPRRHSTSAASSGTSVSAPTARMAATPGTAIPERPPMKKSLTTPTAVGAGGPRRASAAAVSGPVATLSLEDLKARLAAGDTDTLNRAALEVHLSGSEFVTVMGVSRSEWEKMARWKQVRERKRVGLF